MITQGNFTRIGAGHDGLQGAVMEQGRHGPAGLAAPGEQAVYRILLVEDHETLRQLLAIFLRKLGHTVLVAEDGEAAIDLAGSVGRDIDLLLIDIGLPGLGGLEVLEILGEGRPNLRALLVSGYTVDSMELPRGVGVRVGFLPKPFTPAVLQRRIEEIMAWTGGGTDGADAGEAGLAGGGAPAGKLASD